MGLEEYEELKEKAIELVIKLCMEFDITKEDLKEGLE